MDEQKFPVAKKYSGVVSIGLGLPNIMFIVVWVCLIICSFKPLGGRIEDLGQRDLDSEWSRSFPPS